MMRKSVPTLISIATSIIATILYNLFLAHKQDAIRAYLKTRTKGILRRIYVGAFVSGIRGRDGQVEVSILACLILFCFFAGGLSVHFAIKDLITRHEVVMVEFKAKKAGKTEQTQEEYKALMNDIGRQLNSMEEEMSLIRTVDKVIYFGTFAICYFGSLVWLPYLLMRKRFSHEMDRFILQIQGLASKQELAKLAVLESKIKNEGTLKAFIDLTKEIAIQNDIEELVFDFDLCTHEVGAT